MIKTELWKQYKDWVDAENKRIKARNKKRVKDYNRGIVQRQELAKLREQRLDLEWSMKPFLTKLIYGFSRPRPFITYDLRPPVFQEEPIETSVVGYYNWVCERGEFENASN